MCLWKVGLVYHLVLIGILCYIGPPAEKDMSETLQSTQMWTQNKEVGEYLSFAATSEELKLHLSSAAVYG